MKLVKLLKRIDGLLHDSSPVLLRNVSSDNVGYRDNRDALQLDEKLWNLFACIHDNFRSRIFSKFQN